MAVTKTDRCEQEVHVGLFFVYVLYFTYLFDILTQITLKRKVARLVCQRKTLYLQII